MISKLPIHKTQISPLEVTLNKQSLPQIYELTMIQQQTQLMEQIMKNFAERKSNTFSTDMSEMSFDMGENSQSLSSLVQGFENDWGENLQFDSSDSLYHALNQIKRQCSRKTFNLVKDRIRKTEDIRKLNRFDKEVKHNQQLMRRCHELSHEVEQLKNQLVMATKLKTEDKKSNPRHHSMIIEKGETLVKWEKALLYKERLQGETKKKLNKLIKILQEQKNENQQLRASIQCIVQKVMQVEICCNPQIEQIFEYAKQNICKQRQHWKRQEEELNKSEQEIETIVNDLKEALKSFYK